MKYNPILFLIVLAFLPVFFLNWLSFKNEISFFEFSKELIKA